VVLYHYGTENYYKKFDKIKWRNNKVLFNKWCRGETGYPIVDAGMRELNTTGFMHNRARMITASFLIKNCLIDWRWGERYFASKLVDYNISSNGGGWTNILGSGVSAQAPYRVFNPLLQLKKYDSKCEYVKKWIPELADIAIKDIINWNNEQYKKYKVYYTPCLDYGDTKKLWLGELKRL
jgi:deoxyribodipyrimidine photo-lyase